MGKLVEEVQLWNTPLAGGFLLWCFTRGYCDNHPKGDAPVGILHFIAYTILTNKALSDPITNNRADLQSYARSFQRKNHTDTLLSIQPQTIDKREQAFKAIDVAIAEGLLVWDSQSGKIYPRQLEKKPSHGKSLREMYKKDEKKAIILGKWFSGHDIQAITAYLKVIL